ISHTCAIGHHRNQTIFYEICRHKVLCSDVFTSMGKTALLGAARPPHSISNGINLAGAVGVTREFDFGENRLRRRDMRNVVQPFVTALSTDATQSNERVYYDG
ncbi:hypothetical protein, partial [Mesorhizobium sp.]